MISKDCFIKATEEFNTFETPVPAPYFRKTFQGNGKTVKINVAVCGFYEIWFNGEKITKGFLSPYISNTDDYIYCDEYEVPADAGENVIGILLGNGFQNNPGGHIWDFDKAPFRSAPCFALTVEQNGEILLQSSTDFRTAPSPIRSDDYRFGEVYDANFEIDGWNQKGFDDSAWAKALPATAPKGELRVTDVSPIEKEFEIAPVSIEKCEDGYLYDFGQSNAGICRLKINGIKGQRIELRHADSLKDGDLYLRQIWFSKNWEEDKNIVHRDVYICKGNGVEEYQPTYTYHGFRYVKVSGITEEQATKDLLTYLVYHTKFHDRGGFSCSDEVANQLQTMTRRSISSNFHHFPTDCPQREKNGWTADAALSCQAALLNFDPERNYREWMRNICKAQAENGSLPGIIPTGGWGFHWGNGPAWDSVLTWIPHTVYRLRGETEIIEESADSMIKYLQYLRTRVDENGLLEIGLGDWCPVGGGKPKAPLSVTDSIISMDIANKTAEMMDAVGRTPDAEFARSEGAQYRAAIREHLIDFSTMTVLGECQTCQAMGLYYDIFEENEKTQAFQRLLELVHAADDHMDVGVLGGRVLFRVLSDFGHPDLAYHMITRPDFPSYGNWIQRGATTLWENFKPDGVASMNHHFWGDISAWFTEYIGGIRLDATKNTLEIRPSFLEKLDHASAYHLAPEGKISVDWTRTEEGILLSVQIPETMETTAVLSGSFRFESGEKSRTLTTGEYRIIKE